MIFDLIVQLIIGFIIGLGLYCALAYFLAFAILLFDGKFLRFVEWSVNNKWCFFTYYVSVLSIGIISSVLIPDDENVSKGRDKTT